MSTKHLRLLVALLAVTGCLFGTMGCQSQVSGPSSAVMAAVKKSMDAKTSTDAQFAAWRKASGSYKADQLAGRWDWRVGMWDPMQGKYVFGDSGVRLDLAYNAKKPSSLGLKIIDGQKVTKGAVSVATGDPTTMTFYTLGKDGVQMPAGFYLAMYVVGGGESQLLLWDPSRDALYQARRVATERFRALGDEGECVLPELPPMNQSQPGVPAVTPPAPPSTPPVAPPVAPPPTPPVAPPPTPPVGVPTPPTPTPQPPALPPVRPIGPIIGTWQVLESQVAQYVVFRAETFEIYVVYMGTATIMDCGVYAVQGNTLSSRSSVTGKVSTATLSMDNGVLTVASQAGIAKLQRVQ